MRKRQLLVTDKKQVELPPLQKFKVKNFKETIARTERISLNLGSTMVIQDFGTFNTRPEKFVGRNCDVINKSSLQAISELEDYGYTILTDSSCFAQSHL